MADELSTAMWFDRTLQECADKVLKEQFGRASASERKRLAVELFAEALLSKGTLDACEVVVRLSPEVSWTPRGERRSDIRICGRKLPQTQEITHGGPSNKVSKNENIQTYF
ncbi:hypothetical protein [Mesorhizobium sp. M0768]|uniref:hypothetical protein n=1 Tax=Mesorhizobium sp. M0768 TaxID=2956996 RepID=UPI00333BD06A